MFNTSTTDSIGTHLDPPQVLRTRAGRSELLPTCFGSLRRQYAETWPHISESYKPTTPRLIVGGVLS